MNAANIEKTIAADFGKQQNPPAQWKQFISHANINDEENKTKSVQELLPCILTDVKFKTLHIAVEKVVFECNLTIMIGSCRVFGQIPIPDIREISLPADRFSAEGFRAFYECLAGAENIIPRHDLLLDAMAVSEALGAHSTFAIIVACLNNTKIFYELRAFDSFWRGRRNGLDNVANKMLSRVSKSFMLILCTKNFRRMQAADLVTLLKSSQLGVHCEMEIYYAVHLWLDHDYEGRKQHMLKLFQAVRFDLMPMSVLDSLLEDMEKLDPMQTVLLYPMIVEAVGKLELYTWSERDCNFNEYTEERTWIVDPLCKYANETWKLTMSAFLEYLGVVRKTHETFMKRVQFVKEKKSEMDIAHNGTTEGEQELPKPSI